MASVSVSGLLSRSAFRTSGSPRHQTGSHPAYRRNRTAFQCKSRVSDQESILQAPSSFGLAMDHREDYTQIRHSENLTKVRSILPLIDDPLESTLTVDSLERMGIDYHFKKEIGVMLNSMSMNFSGTEGDQMGNLFEVALSFRLLRQAGYPVSPDVFNRFTDKKGRFELSLCKDIRGLLSLYEASQLNKGEDILYKANEFSSRHLKSSMGYLELDCARFIRHAMEHPYHMSLQRYKARHYLSHCQRTIGMNGFLDEVARLDFNIVQSLHQREVKEISSWWKNLGLSQELNFARDQPVKWYLWPMTILPDPQFSTYRIELTKVIAFIYIIDDIFDVYGSLDELSLFVEAIDKWELSAMDPLPPYMRICYKALYNITNEIAQIVFKENGRDPINSLKKSWATLCKAFLLEAKWFASKHVPLADEYLRNGVISSGAHVVLVHIYFLLGQGITKENVDFIESNPGIISCPAAILRLWDDLGSAKDENQEGFDGSYIECYLKEHPTCSTQSAQDHVMNMISNEWENLNKECFSPSPFSPYFVEASLNIARMVQVMYSYDDQQRLPILEEHINLMLFEKM